MAWSELGTQFCVEIAFGVLLAMAFVPKAPVGTFFYRIMGTSALVPLLLACVMPPATGEGAWTDPPVLWAGLAVVAYPVYSGPVRGRNWVLGLALALLGCVGAVAHCVDRMESVEGFGALALGTFSALATGAVAGTVALAMVLGHWYLTVPNLQVSHLRRLNRVTVGAMLASVAALGLICVYFGTTLNERDDALFGATGLFYLGTRVAVGLALPLAFAAMVAGSLKFKNTRSATGILYASTVLVLIGTAVALSLQDTYGVPL
ncbi:MAG: hypothetical protein AAF682_22465 [Planctomycetota bacterium]